MLFFSGPNADRTLFYSWSELYTCTKGHPGFGSHRWAQWKAGSIPRPRSRPEFCSCFLPWFMLHLKALATSDIQIPNPEFVVCPHLCIIYFFHSLHLNHSLLYWQSRHLFRINMVPSSTQFACFTAGAALQSLIQQTCFMTAPNKHPLKSFPL